MRYQRPWRALGLLAVLAGGMTGCSQVTPPGTGTGPATAAPTSTYPPTSTPASPLAPTLKAPGKRAAFLTGVSCAAASECIAVGWYYGAQPSRTLVVRWDGRRWQVASSPSQGHDSQLAAVSCATPADCVAVGSPAEAWTGTRWVITARSSPMSSVSCDGPASCQAVGVSQAGGAGGASRPVAARWDSRGWRPEAMPVPRPAPQTITLAGVSCPSASFCMAVGDDSHGGGARPTPSYRDRTLSYVWAGARWRLATTPSPSPSSKLSGVSCVSPRDCVAVGTSASGRWALAERWDGTRWTIQHPPSVSRVGYTALTGVSCPGPAACIAVGIYNGGTGIAEHWSGGRWSIVRLPSPPGQQFLATVAVSCGSPASCMAVGSSGNTLADVWDGSTWTVTPPPNPA